MKRTRGLERVIRARAPWKRNFSGGGSKMQLDSLCRGGAKVLQDPGRMCWDLMEPGRREELQWRRSHCGFISPGGSACSETGTVGRHSLWFRGLWASVISEYLMADDTSI